MKLEKEFYLREKLMELEFAKMLHDNGISTYDQNGIKVTLSEEIEEGFFDKRISQIRKELGD